MLPGVDQTTYTTCLEHLHRETVTKAIAESKSKNVLNGRGPSTRERSYRERDKGNFDSA